MAAKVRQAQEDASKKVRHDAAMLFELEWAQHNPDFHNAPTYYPAPPSGAGGYPQQQRAPPPPKTLIPVGSEVTIIDFPVRDLNGQKGIVKHYEEKSGRYKIEVQDPKKGAQEFLMPKVGFGVFVTCRRGSCSLPASIVGRSSVVCSREKMALFDSCRKIVNLRSTDF